MTNAFGQSVALATVSAAVLWRLEPANSRQIAGFTALTAFALLCHISTFTLLGAILIALGWFYWWRGRPSLRGPAKIIVGALLIAVVFSVAVYYGHFAEAFFGGARARIGGTGFGHGAAGRVAHAARCEGHRGGEAERAGGRMADACARRDRGRPLVATGAPRPAQPCRRRIDRHVCVFVLGVVLAPVGASFLRYAAEFVTRVTLATAPGHRGAGRARRRDPPSPRRAGRVAAERSAGVGVPRRARSCGSTGCARAVPLLG